MTLLEEIVARLGKYPQAKYKYQNKSIVVSPTSASGFEVGLSIDSRGYTVSFSGWHEKFESREEALSCFVFGLSDQCRLKEFRRGGMAYRWTVESLERDSWIADSTTGLFLFPFWGSREIRYLQNNLIIQQSQDRHEPSF